MSNIVVLINYRFCYVFLGDVTFITEDLPHERYCRHGINLITVYPVTLLEALTGKNLILETLDYRTLHINITQVIT